MTEVLAKHRSHDELRLRRCLNLQLGQDKDNSQDAQDPEQELNKVGVVWNLEQEQNKEDVEGEVVQVMGSKLGATLKSGGISRCCRVKFVCQNSQAYVVP